MLKTIRHDRLVADPQARCSNRESRDRRESVGLRDHIAADSLGTNTVAGYRLIRQRAGQPRTKLAFNSGDLLPAMHLISGDQRKRRRQ